jgi:hypothetical protein
MGTFPGAKARTGRDADHSPPSIAEVENKQELYRLSTQAPPWRVVGQLLLKMSEVYSKSGDAIYRIAELSRL